MVLDNQPLRLASVILMIDRADLLGTGRGEHALAGIACPGGRHRRGHAEPAQGQAASSFGKHNITTRLARPNGKPRAIFIRLADTPFDNNHRLLAYVAPDYTDKEQREIPKHLRPTFNLDLVTTGRAAPFVIYPSIPGAEDLALLISAAATAQTAISGSGPKTSTSPSAGST